MEKFAGYGFNKSHSAAYALLSYQTAWLKAHYPAHFMAAVLSADMEHTDKVVTLIDECEQLGLTVEPPDINASDWQFTARDAKTLRYGLGAIKGVGEGAIEGLLAERRTGGPFADLFSLCRRGEARRLNRRVLEALIRAGALDGLGANRASLAATVEPALRAAEQSAAADATGQEDLFGVAAGDADAPVALPRALSQWSSDSRAPGRAGAVHRRAHQRDRECGGGADRLAVLRAGGSGGQHPAPGRQTRLPGAGRSQCPH